MTDALVIGIDIGKTSFHTSAVDATGAIQSKRKLSRAQLTRHMAAQPVALLVSRRAAERITWLAS